MNSFFFFFALLQAAHCAFSGVCVLGYTNPLSHTTTLPFLGVVSVNMHEVGSKEAVSTDASVFET